MTSIESQIAAVNEFLERIEKNRKYGDPNKVPYNIRVTNHELNQWHKNTENLLRKELEGTALDKWKKADEIWHKESLAGGGKGYDTEYDAAAYRLTLLRGVLLSLKNETETGTNDNIIGDKHEQPSSEKSRTSVLIEKMKGHPAIIVLTALGGVIAFIVTLIKGITYLLNLLSS